MGHGRVVGHVGNAPPLAKRDAAQLIKRRSIQDAEAPSGCSEAQVRFVPGYFALIGSGRRVRRGIAAEIQQAVIGGVQFSSTHSGDQRVAGGETMLPEQTMCHRSFPALLHRRPKRQ